MKEGHVVFKGTDEHFLRVMYFNVFFNVLNFSKLIESFPL